MSLWLKVLYLLKLRRKELVKRPINEDEVTLARRVFADQLPYDKIYIANFFLPGNERVAVTVASGTELIPIKALTEYTIYFGPEVFRDGAHAHSARTRNTFIHELTHVWQGHHSTFSWSYMVNSMFSQGRALIVHRDRDRAYDFEAGCRWDSYNVEQQASMVEKWFEEGMRPEHELYTYIAENIRAGAGG
jgi:hypothetical protein